MNECLLLILFKFLVHQALSSDQFVGFHSSPHYSWEHHQQDIRDVHEFAALEKQGMDRQSLQRQLET
jgi:hypothetical protein